MIIPSETRDRVVAEHCAISSFAGQLLVFLYYIRVRFYGHGPYRIRRETASPERRPMMLKTRHGAEPNRDGRVVKIG